MGWGSLEEREKEREKERRRRRERGRERSQFVTGGEEHVEKEERKE